MLSLSQKNTGWQSALPACFVQDVRTLWSIDADNCG
jgi:hypothetical protein